MPTEVRKKTVPFKKIPVEPITHYPPATDLKSIIGLSRAVERLRRVGGLMVERELAELSRLQVFREAHSKRLLRFLKAGEISADAYAESMAKIDDKIRKKIERAESVVKKRAFLLEPRANALGRKALSDPFFTFLYSHAAFSEQVQIFFADGRNGQKPMQTVAMFDVDNVNCFALKG